MPPATARFLAENERGDGLLNEDIHSPRQKIWGKQGIELTPSAETGTVSIPKVNGSSRLAFGTPPAGRP